MKPLRLAVPPDELGNLTGRLRGVCVEPLERAAGCDAVLLVGTHEMVAGYLTSGKHVLLVSPPYAVEQALDGLVTHARGAGVQLVVANPERYLPSRQLFHRQLAGPLGEAGLLRLHRWEATAAPSVDLPEALVRDLDVTLWLAGQSPERVFALGHTGTDVPGRYLQIHLGFAGGGMALLDYTDSLPAGDGYVSLSAIAARGAAYADDHQNVQLVYQGGRPRAARTAEHSNQLAALATEFCDALCRGTDAMLPSVTAWKAAVEVIESIRTSLATGRAVAREGR